MIPELEFAETPIGMIYIATRRVGDNVWARMAEAIAPNLQQVARRGKTASRNMPLAAPC